MMPGDEALLDRPIAATRRSDAAARARSALAGRWFVILAAIMLAAPVLRSLASIVWTTEQGAQGPLVLATGLWLLAYEARRIGVTTRGAGGAIGRALVGVAAGGVVYVVAAIMGMLWLQCVGLFLALLACFYAYVGGDAIRRLWFPLAYLLFVIPPPYAVIAPATRALKLMISSASVNILSTLGYEVASSGTTLFIDQYEVLVAAACSGMNSIMSLLAVGLFYIYLRHRADWRYAAILAVLVLPIAIATNMIRVLLLLLLTHYAGEAVAQGMLHEAAGMMMFFVALFVLFAVDMAVMPLYRRARGLRA